MLEPSKCRADDLPELALGLIGIAYVLSLTALTSLTTRFFVLRTADILIIVGASTLPILLAAHFIRQRKGSLVFAGVHLCLAFLFHPHVAAKDQILRNEREQARVLTQFQQGTVNDAADSKLAYALAESLESEALWRFNVDHPLLSWAYPPSAVLALWSVVFFVLFTPRRGQRPPSS